MGAIKQASTSAKGKAATDSYDLVCSMLFTNGKVDPEKVVCLHLLAAHCPQINNDGSLTARPITPLLERGKHGQFTGAWNNFLPCYVINRRHTKSDASEDLKLHEDPRQVGLEERAMRDFEEKYQRYLESNSAHRMATSANAKLKKTAPTGLGRMPIISSHVYSLLDTSHELKVRQTLAEDPCRKKGVRSSHELDLSDVKSHSLRSDNEYQHSSVFANGYSTERCDLKSSGRLTFESSFIVNPDITMIRRRREKSVNRPRRRDFDDVVCNELLLPRNTFMKKSNFGAIKEISSEALSVKSHFHNPFDDSMSVCSLVSDSPALTKKNLTRCIYLNSPLKSVELRNKNYKIVRILVNYQTQALVHSVLEVLQRVNPEKTKKIIEIARNPVEIKRMLDRAETQSFLETLKSQSLITSPESFVVSVATLVNEIDPRLEVILEKEIIAFTLDTPKTPVWDELVNNVQNNIFHATSKISCSSSRIAGTCSTVQKGLKEGKVDNEDVFNNIKNPVAIQKSLDPNERQSLIRKSENLPMNSQLNAQMLISTSSCLGETEYANVLNAEEIKNPGNMISIRNSNSTKKRTNDDQNQNIKPNVSALKMEYKKVQKPIVNKYIGTYTGSKTTNVSKDRMSTSCQYKFSRATQDCHCAEADRIILQRLTNSQRILVGQACAALKTRKINNEGLIEDRTPLAAFIAPALSRESIKELTRGTIYATKDNISDNEQEQEEKETVATTITGSLLAELQQEIARNETDQRLRNFLKTGI